MESDPTRLRRVWHLAARGWKFLRTAPRLTMIAALAGVLAFAGLAVRGLHRTAGPAQVEMHVEYAASNELRRELRLELFSKFWNLGSLCLLPAAVLAALRLRGRDALLAVTLACGWLALRWIGSDLLRNLSRILNDPLGMKPSPGAYVCNLGFMLAFVMSPPLLLALYLRAPLLDRYVVRNLLTPLILCLAGIAGLMITMDLLNNANDFVAARLGPAKVCAYYLSQMPRILVTITESALLLATLYALGRMSRYNELVSMLTAGRSVFRVLLPVMVIGLWGSLAIMALNFQQAPEADQAKEDMLEGAGRGTGGDKEARRTAAWHILYRNREERRTWYVYRMPFNLSGWNKMDEIYVRQDDAGGRTVRFLAARHATWDPKTGVWSFTRVRDYNFTNADGSRCDHPQPVDYGLVDITAPLWRETPGSILSERRDPDYLGVPGLLSYLKTNAALPESSLARYHTILQWRFALPLRCFLMVLVAAPLGIVATRRNMVGGVSAAVGIFIAVYFLSAILLKAGEGGYLPPFAGAWLLNIVCLAVGLGIFYCRARNRSLASLNPFRRRVRATG